MRHVRSIRLAAVIALLVAVLLGGGAASAVGSGMPAPTKLASADGTRHVLHDLVGTWDVRQRMWTGPGAQPLDLPPATATVRLAPRDAYLEEEMTQVGDTDAFTRHALLGYNAITRSYEYVSIDSRAPQLMAYPTQQTTSDGGLWFTLASPFVLPEWGQQRDVAFKGRLQIQPGRHRYTVRLYWVRLSGQPSDEFLAMEYVYTRK